MPPLDLKALLSRFAATISQGSLGVVDHVPESWALPMAFIQNVLIKIKRDGGSALYGWVFLSRASLHGEYLIALHYSLWSPADRTAPIDINPFHEDLKFQPFCPTPGKVLFLADEAAQPKMIGRAVSPLPSRFFPVTDDPNLAAYVEKLNVEEQTHFAKLGEDSFGTPGSQRTH
jgi:hypothetical protein